MPRRLALRLAMNGGEAEIGQIAGVTFDRGNGKAMITKIGGPISGEFGPGSMEIDEAGSIDLETRRTEIRVMNVAGELKLDAQSGEVRVRGAQGPTTLSLQRVVAEVEDLTGPLTVEGNGGELRVRNVRTPVKVDVERMEVALILSSAVPVTASTTGDTMEVTLPPNGLTLEASTEGGQIRATDSAVAVATEGNVQRTSVKLRGGGPLVKLESTRGDIVIR